MTAPQSVYVVDDELAQREMVGDYLRMHGFDVKLFDGGAALRGGLKEEVPDIIILDLNMPEEDGLSIIRYMKDHYTVPVIMLTATASAIDRVVGLELGADDYLAKPCELRELLARMRSVLRRQKFSPARHLERRLAAIASFDFVGFGHFIQEDEPGTLSALDALFSEVISPSIVQFRGTLFKMLGDGALVEFNSVVDAVEWAAAFQTAIKAYPADLFPHVVITFRVGIAVGDIVVSQNDRFGEGVTMAARIEQVAEPGSVTLTDYAHNLVRGKTNIAFRDCGPKALKNVSSPMRIWTWSPP